MEETDEERVTVMKKWSVFFLILAVLLSDAMCAVVGFGYSSMLWGINYACYSAPACVAFLYAIPFLVGIAVCLLLAVWIQKR